MEIRKVTTDRDLYFNPIELKNRGWTESRIERFLGQEDRRVENPYHKNGPGIRHYLRTRVAAAEATAEFQQWWAKSQKRKYPINEPWPRKSTG